jgi:catechol 2,3-dioxygenase-like lactoylglutathione lyase family enzyme
MSPASRFRQLSLVLLGMVFIVLSGGHELNPSPKLARDAPPGPDSGAGSRKILLLNNLTGPQHLGIPVTNLEKSRTFYERLGFRQVMSADLPQGNESVKVAMMDFKGFIIELYQLTGEDLAEIRSRKDGHIDHIALDVRDIGEAFRELKAAGLTVVEKEPVYLPFWEKGIKYFNVLGPDGERIEFSERLR